ncbi:hypothetical protein [Comamonas sp.]|uniref:hypothetical protein n=1 Tax=Comamonas sp. TaxID=34028 RepID=UPI003A8FD2A3
MTEPQHRGGHNETPVGPCDSVASKPFHGQQSMAKEQRQHLADAAILVLLERFGHDVARHLLEAIGRPEVVAAFPRALASQYAQQLHADGLSPRDASYRIAELTGMSVRNARRYADAAVQTEPQP